MTEPESEGDVPPQNCVRQWFWYVDRSDAWTWLVNLAIIANTLVLMLDAPYAWYAETAPGLVNLSERAELYFTAAFTVEMLVRLLAIGPFRYFRSFWSWLDVLVIVLGWTEFALTQGPSGSGSGNFSVLRSFRILRAMRAMRTLPQLQHIIQCLFIAILDLGNVVLLLGMVFLVFGLVGIVLFGGTLHYQCVDDRTGQVVGGEQRCNREQTQGFLCAAGQTCTDVFDNPNQNLTSFDHMGFAFITIFQCVTGEGWADVMYLLMDATSAAASVIYFVALTVFATWFCINLLVAVLSEAYTSVTEEADAKRDRLRLDAAQAFAGGRLQGLLRKERVRSMARTSFSRYTAASPPASEPSHRRAWYNGRAALWSALTIDPRPSEHVDKSILPQPDTLEEAVRRARERLLVLVESLAFRVPIVLMILTNAVVLTLDGPYRTPEQRTLLSTIDQALAACFAAELLVKVLALGPKQYWASGLNRVDALIVAFSIVDWGVQASGARSLEAVAQVVTAARSMRLLRIFKLLSDVSPTIRSLIQTTVSSLAACAYLLLVLLIFICIFAILAMQQFGGAFADRSRYPEPPRFHFDDIIWSFVTIFQVVSTENWPEVLFETYGAVGITAIPFFMAVVVLGNFFAINLFLGILLAKFDNEESHQKAAMQTARRFLDKHTVKRSMGKAKEKVLDYFGPDKEVRRQRRLTLEAQREAEGTGSGEDASNHAKRHGQRALAAGAAEACATRVGEAERPTRRADGRVADSSSLERGALPAAPAPSSTTDGAARESSSSPARRSGQGVARAASMRPCANGGASANASPLRAKKAGGGAAASPSASTVGAPTPARPIAAPRSGGARAPTAAPAHEPLPQIEAGARADNSPSCLALASGAPLARAADVPNLAAGGEDGGAQNSAPPNAEQSRMTVWRDSASATKAPQRGSSLDFGLSGRDDPLGAAAGGGPMLEADQLAAGAAAARRHSTTDSVSSSHWQTPRHLPASAGGASAQHSSELTAARGQSQAAGTRRAEPAAGVEPAADGMSRPVGWAAVVSTLAQWASALACSLTSIFGGSSSGEAGGAKPSVASTRGKGEGGYANGPAKPGAAANGGAGAAGCCGSQQGSGKPALVSSTSAASALVRRPSDPKRGGTAPAGSLRAYGAPTDGALLGFEGSHSRLALRGAGVAGAAAAAGTDCNQPVQLAEAAAAVKASALSRSRGANARSRSRSRSRSNSPPNEPTNPLARFSPLQFGSRLSQHHSSAPNESPFLSRRSSAPPEHTVRAARSSIPLPDLTPRSVPRGVSAGNCGHSSALSSRFSAEEFEALQRRAPTGRRVSNARASHARRVQSASAAEGGSKPRPNQLLVDREREHARAWGINRSDVSCSLRASSDGAAAAESQRSLPMRHPSSRHVWLNTFEQSAAEAEFRKYDNDGDGTVEEPEVHAMLRHMAEGRMSLAELQMIFDECDEEGVRSLDLPRFLRFLAIKHQREAQLRAESEMGESRRERKEASSVAQLATAASSMLGGMLCLRAGPAMPLTGVTLFCLGERNCFRVWVHRLVSSASFDLFMLVVILATTAVLPIEQQLTRDMPAAIEPDAYLYGAQFEGAGGLRALYYFSMVTIAVFVAEIVLRIVAQTWRGYFSDAWHYFDVLMVLIAIATFHPSLMGLSNGLRVLRPALALRPFRLVPRLPGVRVIGSAVVYSIPHVAVLLLLLGVCSLILGVIGVALFGGKFGRCVDESGELITQSLTQMLDITRAALAIALRQMSSDELAARGLGSFELELPSLPTDKGVCLEIARLGDVLRRLGRAVPFEVEWFLPMPNFDYTEEAVLALFQISTLSEWPDVMHAAIDMTGFEKQPVRDAQQTNLYWPAFYFLVTVFISSYVLANLFVGVILQHFARFRGMHDGSILLTPDQRAWVHTQHKMLKLRPRALLDEPAHPVRRFCFRLVHKREWAAWRKTRLAAVQQPEPHLAAEAGDKEAARAREAFAPDRYHGGSFEKVILLCIAANTIISMTRHRGQPASYDAFMENSSMAFTAVFAIEAAIKITALGPRYFKVAWNKFDFAIVLLSLLELAVTSGGWFTRIPPGTLASMRSVRAVRVLRLMKGFSALRKIMSTLYFSLPQLANVALLLVLAIFAFAVIGVELLGTAPEVGPYGGVSRQANFASFPTAALTLFVAISGEKWSGLMWDYRYFGQQGLLNGWSSGWAVAYFSIYVIVMAYMLLSVFVAVLMEAFEDVREQSLLPIGSDAIKAFALEWSVWDPERTNFIPVEHLGTLVSMLQQPLAPRDVGNDRNKVAALVSALRVPVRAGRVHYVEVLLSLAEQHYWEAADLPPSAQLLVDRMATQWVRLYPSLRGMAQVDGYSDEPEIVERILGEWDRLRGAKVAERAKEEAKDGVERSARESMVNMQRVVNDEEGEEES